MWGFRRGLCIRGVCGFRWVIGGVGGCRWCGFSGIGFVKVEVRCVVCCCFGCLKGNCVLFGVGEVGLFFGF